MRRKKPELLAPAGNMEKLKMAFLYGADAVDLGGEADGLRAQGGNFSRAEMAEAARFAHERGKRIYVTVNVYPHNEELSALPDYLRYLHSIGADAILVSDFGVFSIARETVPDLPVHISTQANTVNYATAEAWARLGAERVVLARELSVDEIREIRARCGVERRVFYYHFKDKYDLVAWMFERDYSQAEEAGEPYSVELYAQAHHRLWGRRSFYRRAFSEDSQNSIYRYLLQFSIEANEAALKRHLGVPSLALPYAFEARHFAHANVGCLVDWLNGEIDATPEQLARQMFACMPATLRKAYEQPR